MASLAGLSHALGTELQRSGLQILISTLLYTVPLLAPLYETLRTSSKIKVEDPTVRQGSCSLTRPLSPLQVFLHSCTTLLLAVQLLVSFWATLRDSADHWKSFCNCYWLAVLLVSLAGASSPGYRRYIFFLCLCPFVDSLLFTVLPLFEVPARRKMTEDYISLALQIVLLSIAMSTPREWQPIDPSDADDQPSPEQVCTPFSYYISYYWIEYLIRLSFNREVVTNDLPPVPDYDKARLWKHKILEARTDSLLWTLLSLMQWELITMTSLAVLISLTQFVSPLAMRQLLQYLESPGGASMNPFLWAGLILIGPLAWAISREMYIFVSTRLTIRVKSALTQLVYMKVMIMKVSDGSEETSTGKISNLMSTDIAMITMARELFLVIIQLPASTAVSLFLLHQMMGWAAFVGFGILLLTMPVPGYLASYMASYQRAASLATDARLSAINENINSIRITKLFGWEKSRIDVITQLREDEQLKLWRRNFVSILIGIVTDILPSLNMFITFLVFTKIMGRTLTSSIAFTSISYFEILRAQFLWVGFLSRNVIQSQVSLRRIETFLNDAEEIRPSTDPETSMRNQLSGLSCQWAATNGGEIFMLKNINVNFQPGLNLIIGQTGSGKSSLLLAMLGEMTTTSGVACLKHSAGVAYVAQTPWLQNASIRDNILFGSALDPRRYRKVITACALLEDFKSLTEGDETEVGEKGVALSGGQKQRVSLARALYSQAHTLLLDDVLSALDGNTSADVFHNGIIGDLGHGRTIIMVTHAIGLCGRYADQVVTMKHGAATIRRQESVADLRARHNEELEATRMNLHRRDTNHSMTDQQVKSAMRLPKFPGGSLNDKEEQSATGRISRYAIFSLLKEFGSPAFLILLPLVQICYQSLSITKSLFPAYWADAYDRNAPEDVNLGFYLGIYAAIILAEALMNGLCNVFVYHGNWQAAGKLHNRLLRSVFYTPLSWYDKNPVGRIVNRFARDIQALDTTITPWIRMSIDGVLKVSFTILSITSVLPLFAVPAILASIAGFIIGEVYTRTQIVIKRLVSVSESPLFSQFGDSIAGIVTIRAFGAQKRFGLELEEKIDRYTRPSEVLFALTRWSQIRADGLGALVSFSAALLALLGDSKDAGLVGFSLSISSGFSVTLLTLVRALNELEIELNSFERVKQYTNLEQEQPDSETGQVPATWPVEGDVKVSNLYSSYAPGGPNILKDVSFSLKAGEKVGIVGRSGSGKSTLGLSLLRFTHRSAGTVVINGLDVEEINLSALRQRITIIPQDPILFTGTVRSNLDPFGTISDAELTAALSQCGFHPKTHQLHNNNDGDERLISLDTKVLESGSNFSQGQRQILALTRAMVRHSKLIILDEATASCDMDTDRKIQETLRGVEFARSTVLTIAHRLRTICDYDRILVLQSGKVVEFDEPKQLMAIEGGIFRGMVEESEEAEELVSLIKLS